MDATTRFTDPLATQAPAPGKLGAPSRPEPGDALGHYRIDELCGSGGMGSVYRAWDCALERPAAIKLLHASKVWSDNSDLQRETHALSRLQHPNIASFFEAGEVRGQCYLALEFVEGISLARRLLAGPLEGEELQRLASGLLWALAHAHAAGVVHCDIKPANIMLREDLSPVLLDFGVAKLLSADLQTADATQSGLVRGSPGYMAPEQILGASLTERSDLYAVGLVLLEAITGQQACGGRDAVERAQATLRGEPRLRAEQLTSPLRNLLVRALQGDPAQRPASAAAMQFELQQIWQQHESERSTARLLAAEPDCRELEPSLRWIGTAVSQSVRGALAGQTHITLASAQAIADARAGNTAISNLALGQKLGCRWVVDGQIAGDALGLKVILALSDARTGQLVSQIETSCALEAVFGLHAELLSWLSGQLLGATQLAAPPFGGSEAELCARAELAFRRGGKDGMTETEACYRAVIADKPKSVAALTGLAGVLALRYPFTSDPALLVEAERWARLAIRVDKNASEARSWLAYVLFRQGRHRAGIAQATRARDGLGDTSMAWYFGACCHAALAHWKPALASFQVAIRVDRNRGFSWIGAAWCHHRLGNFDEALFCIRTAERLESADVPLRTAGCGAFLGEMLRQGGELDAAWHATRSALQRVEQSDFFYRDSYRTFALLTLGRISLQRDDAGAASTAFKQALAAMEARPSTLGGGHLMVQALAGLAAAASDPDALARAQELFAQRAAPWNFDWNWGSNDRETQIALSEAARALAKSSTTVTGVGADKPPS